MSKVIKASQITGEYKLEENSYLRKKEEVVEDNSQEEKISQEDMSQDEIEVFEGIILEAKQQAAAIIEEAEEAAAEIKNRLEQEQEDAYQQGFEKGYQEGLEKGTLEGERKTLEELNVLLDSFDNILKKTEDELENSIDDLQRDVISLAVQISKKIVASQIEFNPELINTIVHDMLSELTEVEELNVYINTHLIQYIVEADFKSEYMTQKINFIADSSIKPGDCIIETTFGGKDGTLENKFYLLENELLKGAGFNEED
ncbi:MAG: FliH/SctL family protein [Halanaerobiales bacterium]